MMRVTAASATKERTQQFEINHRKWIDIAHIWDVMLYGQIAADLKM